MLLGKQLTPHTIHKFSSAQRHILQIATTNNMLNFGMKFGMMGSNQCHLKILTTDQNGGREKGGEFTIMDFGTRTIIFDLTNVTKCLVDQINPFIGKRKSCITFMAKRNILVGIKADMMEFCEMNGGIIFKAGGEARHSRHTLFEKLEMEEHH